MMGNYGTLYRSLASLRDDEKYVIIERGKKSRDLSFFGVMGFRFRKNKNSEEPAPAQGIPRLDSGAKR
uniref:Uncharacterized protein n=1 Tax=Candidatus Kentrum sp. TC TaxID=2126339 RepID=A0A450Y8J4_9GAMM|nr:MAG: hypothetical protein BECKTC1821E_GA0114239_1001114 [Candidatus Kentron sp. TC]